MDNATEIIILAVSVIITAVVIVAAMSLATVSRSVPSTMISQLNETSQEMDEYQYTKYGDMYVNGSDVLSAARKLSKKDATVAVTIFTGPTSITTYSTASDSNIFTNWQNLPSNTAKYINPGADFYVTISRNANDLIEKITFTQKAYVATITVTSLSDEGVVTNESGYVESASSSDDATASDSVVDDSSSASDELIDGESSEETEEEVDEDLEVVFSDEGENGTTESEESATLKKFKEELQNIQNDFDELNVEDLTADSSEYDVNAKLTALNEIREKVVSLSDEYSSSDTLSKSNQRFVEESGIKLLRSIDEIIDNLSIITSEEEVVK
jgi:hypothetical protein